MLLYRYHFKNYKYATLTNYFVAYISGTLYMEPKIHVIYSRICWQVVLLQNVAYLVIGQHANNLHMPIIYT